MSSSSTTANNITTPGTTTPDEQPPPYNHRTTSSILTHALATTLSLLPTTLSLALLLFSFHTLLLNSTVLLSSFLLHHPSLLHLTTTTTSPPQPPPPPPHHPQPSFLTLSLLHTDTDLFSRPLFPPSPFNNSSLPLFILQDGDGSGSWGGGGGGGGVKDPSPSPSPNAQHQQLQVAGLLFFITVFSTAYGWVILAYVVTYSWLYGVVFVGVVNDLLTRYSSVSRTLWAGSGFGVRRLSGFVLMRWAVRDAVTQVLGLWFFGEVRDQFLFFKLFLRLKLMPFSVSLSWVEGYDKEVSGFLFAWNLVDTVVSFVLAVNPWVTIVNTRRGGGGGGGGDGGREIVKEGWYLLVTMIHQSVQLKCLELIFCGAFMRWVLERVFGRSLAILLQSFVEVYFMVAWLIYYFAARCKDASLNGRRFGRRELEGLIEELR